MSKQHSSDAGQPGATKPAERSQNEPTGVPNLDRVLGGGLPRGTLAIIMGPPGSGKTTLANQIIFAGAHRGRRSVVISAISEPTSKLIAHLRAFDYFDDSFVGDRIQFLSLEQFLPQGLSATGDELITIARRARADFVLLDGFRGVRGADVDMQAARQFLYDIGTTLSALGITTLITSEADSRDPAFFPETTTADIIVGLYYTLSGVQQRRAIEVIKMRGSEPKPGLHGFTIAAEGTRVYPRLETNVHSNGEPLMPEELVPEMLLPEDEERSHERLPFHIPALDELLGGGLLRGTSTLLIGSLGTGKTILGLHFAEAGVRQGEQTLFLGFREQLGQLMFKASTFDLGQELRAALGPTGLLTMQRWAPVELKPDIVADRLITTMDRTGTRRLIIDSIAELEASIMQSGDAVRISSFFGALLEALRQRGVTSLFIKEQRATIHSQVDLSAGPMSVLAENVILTHQIERGAQLVRVLSVVKTRFSPHDATLHEFAIRAPEGILMLGPYAAQRDAIAIQLQEGNQTSTDNVGLG